MSSGPISALASRTPMFWTTTGSISTPGAAAISSSYRGPSSIPIALLPGRSEMEAAPSIGSHQYATFLSPPFEPDGAVRLGTSAIPQIGQAPGPSPWTSGCIPQVQTVPSAEAEVELGAAGPGTRRGPKRSPPRKAAARMTTKRSGRGGEVTARTLRRGASVGPGRARGAPANHDAWRPAPRGGGSGGGGRVEATR